MGRAKGTAAIQYTTVVRLGEQLETADTRSYRLHGVLGVRVVGPVDGAEDNEDGRKDHPAV